MALHVPAPRINDIVRERRGVTADTAIRLAHYFGMSAEFWMGLQTDYEMAMIRKSVAKDLKTITPLNPALAASGGTGLLDARLSRYGHAGAAGRRQGVHHQVQ